MSNYVKAVSFAPKDSLPSGDPFKVIKGTEIDTEYNAIATAISSKADLVSPVLTGTPTAPTAATGTNTTQLATTAFVSASQGTMAAQNKTAVDITGGTIVGITDLLPADGGTGVSTLTRNALVVGNGTSAVSSVLPSTNGNFLTSTAGATVAAASLVEGTQYTIASVGATATNWVAIGAASATVGTVFIKNSTAATGDGTATTNVWTSQTYANTPAALSTATGSAPSYSARAFVNFDGATIVSTAMTFVQTTSSVVVTLAGHGYQVGHRVGFDKVSGTTGTSADGLYTITAVTTDTLTFTGSSSTSGTGSGFLRTATLRGSSNIFNVAYNDAGVYGINFTTAMPNANYACMANCSSTGTSASVTINDAGGTGGIATTPTTQSIVIFTRTGADSSIDATYVNAVIFA